MAWLEPQIGDVDYIAIAAETPKMYFPPHAQRGRGEYGVPAGPAIPSRKEELYMCIVRQLHSDGHFDAAEAVADSAGITVPFLQRDGGRLSRIFELGCAAELSTKNASNTLAVNHAVEGAFADSVFFDSTVPRSQLMTTEAWCSSSLAPQRSSCFTADGEFVVCGAVNGCIRVFSLSAIEQAKTAAPQAPQGGLAASNFSTNWALARQYTDHSQSVEWLGFHPQRQTLLASASRDGAIFLRDIASPHTPSYFKGGTTNSTVAPLVADTYPVRCGAFHPGGSLLLYGTDHNVVRLIDLATEQMFAAGAVGEPEHTAAICDVCYDPTGAKFATCGYDGCLNVYDGVNGRSIAHKPKAHSSVPVTSCTFSMSGNVLLSAGMDNQMKLWDLRMLCCEAAAFGVPSKTEHKLRAKFTWSERMIVASVAQLTQIVLIDVYSGGPVASLEHAAEQRTFSVSPTQFLVATAGDDCRLRLWSAAI